MNGFPSANDAASRQYLLLFRGNDWHRGLSAEEMQNTMARWVTWFEGLKAQGKIQSAQPLGDEGKIVTVKKGRSVVADGPFAESKEAVAGYFLVEVADEAEAIEIARRCPTLEHGLACEVRPVVPSCMIFAEAGFETASVAR